MERLDPDIVTLDIEMPRLDGLRTLERLMAERPRPVVIVSAYTAEGSRAAIEALELGAVDCVVKPSGPISLDMAKVEGRLFEALQAAAAADLKALLRMPGRARGRREVRLGPGGGEARVAVAIGASTGGPRALAQLLPQLPADLGAVILLVQHMPPSFTESLARRLDHLCPFPVRQAEGGEVPAEGAAYLAPGDFHMRVRRGHTLRLALDQAPPVWGVRPSADVLFDSVAEVYGARTVGVILTGMGRDGGAGLQRIRTAGGSTLVQDKESAVVYGMPAHCLALGAAEAVVDLSDMAGVIAERVQHVRTAPPSGDG